MSRNRIVNQYHTIPLKKGYVKGYYERRNGRLVWVSPYQNSKDKKPDEIDSKVQKVKNAAPVRLPAFDGEAGKVSAKPVIMTSIEDEKYNFILQAIVATVKTIDGFEPGEIVKLSQALKTARAIVSELGYLDDGIAGLFNVPDAKRSKLGSKAARETAAMAKELKRLSRRVTKSTLRYKVQKLSSTLDGAI